MAAQSIFFGEKEQEIFCAAVRNTHFPHPPLKKKSPVQQMKSDVQGFCLR
jgi:hypothetical protein